MLWAGALARYLFLRLCQAIVSRCELADDSTESQDLMYSQLVMKLVSQHGLAPFDSAFARHKLAICVKSSWMFATQRMTCWQNVKLDWLSDQFLLLHTPRCSQFAYKIILRDLYIAAALLIDNACNRISQTSIPAAWSAPDLTGEPYTEGD